MSDGPADAIAERVAQAIGDVLREHGGGMVTAYTLVVDFIDADGDHSWATAYADNQRPATTLGLLRWQTLAIEEQARAYLRGEDPNG